MDRMVEEIGGVYPTHPEWDWLWASMWFCADPESWAPRDMGGWCHSPNVAALFGAGELYLGVNAYGTALGLNNNTNDSAWGSFYYWSGSVLEMGHTPESNWTLAFGAQKWGANSGEINMASLVVYAGSQHRFYYNTAGYFRYQFASQAVLDGSCPDLAQQDEPCTFVLTSDGTGVNRMYADGQLIAERSSGSVLIAQMTTIRVGGHPDAKQPKCWGGTIGPIVMSRHAWSHAQVAQWSADPWGFVRPAVAPILPQWRQPWEALTCDVQTRSAVSADARTRAAVITDAQSRAAVIADAQARAAAVADAQARSAVVADVEIQGD